MLSAGWLVLFVLLAVLLTAWVTFTLTRLDRLHARVDAAQAALDAQLVRRVAALRHAAEAGYASHTARSLPDRDRFEAIAHAALLASSEDRPSAENEVGRAVTELAGHPDDLTEAALSELHESAVRVSISRRFYNDAVRDTRALRNRRMPRVLHLSGRRELPQFFDIDDTVPPDKGAGGNA
jgi:hypothetical protein